VRLPVHMIDAYHRIAKSNASCSPSWSGRQTTERDCFGDRIETEKAGKDAHLLGGQPGVARFFFRSLSDDDGRRASSDVLVDPNEAPAPPDQMMSSETQREMLKLLSVLKAHRGRHPS